MKRYDVVVIGAGSGMIIVEQALNAGLKVALIESTYLGGTCLNVGCIPTKMLLYPADRIREIEESEKLGIKAEVKKTDFKAIMQRMRKVVKDGRSHMEKGIKNTKNLAFYKGKAKFVDDYVLEVKGEKIKGEKIFIAAGARPLIPPIKGLEEAGYFTNENILEINKPLESIVIIGGGYIAVEFAHFLAATGTKVTILQAGEHLIPQQDEDITKLLKEELKKRMKTVTGVRAREVKKLKNGYVVTGETKKGQKKKFTAKHIMLATGRKPNSDELKVEKTGVKTDKKGYIKVNSYLETSKKNIWAIGDINGKYMFKHVANREAAIAWQNANKRKQKMDYSAVPYAVFTWPQIAAVGMTEKEARKKYRKVNTGKVKYFDTAKGQAMAEKKSFAKAIAKDGKLIGFHIIGPYAPILVQEATAAIASGKNAELIRKAMHIHPALTELIARTTGRI